MHTRRLRTTLWVLLIAAVLGSAYLIVTNNNARMGGAGRDAPSGLMH